MSADRRYVQRLPAVALAIERATERTPDISRFHVFQGDELLSSFRRLADAQALFRDARDASGWQPESHDLTAGEQLEREREASERYAQAEHWHRVSSRRGWFKGHRV